MKLSKQLLIISLLTLVIPWAGYLHLQEIDGLLRQSQSQVLMATANATAARISSEAELVDRFKDSSPNNHSSFYAADLAQAIVVDGYDEDWRPQNVFSYSFPDTVLGNVNAATSFLPNTLSVQLGVRRRLIPTFQNRRYIHNSPLQDTLYIIAKVSKANISYHHPGKSDAINGDHLRLRLTGKDGSEKNVSIGASAPGQVQVRQISAINNQKLGASKNELIEHRISGVWRETSSGYQIELSMPLELALNGLSLNATLPSPEPSNSDGNPVPQAWAGNLHWDSTPPMLNTQNPELKELLQVFIGDASSLALANQQAQLMAIAAPFQSTKYTSNLHPFKAWFYRLLLQTTQLNPRDPSIVTGKFNGQVIGQAILGIPSASWHQEGQQLWLRVVTPIIPNAGPREGQVVGLVIAEQNNDNQARLMNSAVMNLLLYASVVSVLVGGGLLLYASWLSWRIRRLSQLSSSAIDESGSLNETAVMQLENGFNDELGDLGRNYAQLLWRLQGYTGYLKTLSAKLSHELRTPLAIVKTSLENLNEQNRPEENLSAQDATYVQRALAGSERLSSILNAMSAANQVESAINAADPEQFCLADLCQHMVKAYSDTFSPQLFHSSIIPKAPFFGSPELIVQLLDKLIDNAVDFCSAEQAIYISLKETHNHYQLTIENDGPLLPTQMSQQIFDSLVSIRAHKADNEVHLGLGLHIVKLISEYHHGQLQAHNRADHSGVVFLLTLPKQAPFHASANRP